MKAETEDAVRNILGLDSEVGESLIDRVVAILKGESDEIVPQVPILKRKLVLELLKCHRRTLDYYVEQGYLKRAYRPGTKRAVGITRDSFVQFTTLRTDR